MGDGLGADEVIERLRLEPHPEGGHYRQTWVAETDGDERAAGTAIFFLLAAGERSHWHRVDATEIWHHDAGAPLVLSTVSPGFRFEGFELPEPGFDIPDG